MALCIAVASTTVNAQPASASGLVNVSAELHDVVSSAVVAPDERSMQDAVTPILDRFPEVGPIGAGVDAVLMSGGTVVGRGALREGAAVQFNPMYAVIGSGVDSFEAARDGRWGDATQSGVVSVTTFALTVVWVAAPPSAAVVSVSVVSKALAQASVRMTTVSVLLKATTAVTTSIERGAPAARAVETGDALRSTASSGAGRSLPMNMETVCATACKYGIDISDVTIKINKARAGDAGSTASDGTITLTRSAFANEEQLARTLFHERFHDDQIRSGLGYPTSPAAAGPWESAAYAAEEAWWGSR